ncbi:MAG: hypothetical protein Q8T03_06620 [Bacteroidota bacterium]|nr:hypothetical protein [Bacteroidota bacterium]
MCFSASASFGVSAILMAGGVITLKKTYLKSQIPFAAIPIIFSIQQFIEGVLWLSLTTTAYASWHKPATYIFLTFAQIIWPTLVPFSMLLLEKNSKKRKIISIILLIGIAISLYLAYCILFYAVNSSISKYHISYDLDYPHLNSAFNIGGVFYLIATVAPAFISSVKKMNIIGVTLVISFVISRVFFFENLVSVWCFFAATISVIVFYIIAAYSIPEKAPNSIY